MTDNAGKRICWKVLLVDDNPNTIHLVRRQFQSVYLEIFTAQSVEDAIKLLVNPATRPDLVLLDVIMPGVDGIDLCRFIKTNDMFRHIKVFLCSSIEKEKLTDIASECGADGLVHKQDILGRWVMEQLQQEEMHRQG